MKLFYDWIRLKITLNKNESKPPYVSEGDIWWAAIGQNVGSEIYGKSTLFSRPVIILKKFSDKFYFVIPASTSIKEGSWYASYTYKRRLFNACLHQARSIDYRRLYSKLGAVNEIDFIRIKTGFIDLYIKDFPRHFWRGRG
jgi:mRNA interferase MazF